MSERLSTICGWSREKLDTEEKVTKSALLKKAGFSKIITLSKLPEYKVLASWNALRKNRGFVGNPKLRIKPESVKVNQDGTIKLILYKKDDASKNAMVSSTRIDLGDFIHDFLANPKDVTTYVVNISVLEPYVDSVRIVAKGILSYAGKKINKDANELASQVKKDSLLPVSPDFTNVMKNANKKANTSLMGTSKTVAQYQGKHKNYSYNILTSAEYYRYANVIPKMKARNYKGTTVEYSWTRDGLAVPVEGADKFGNLDLISAIHTMPLIVRPVVRGRIPADEMGLLEVGGVVKFKGIKWVKLADEMYIAASGGCISPYNDIPEHFSLGRVACGRNQYIDEVNCTYISALYNWIEKNLEKD